MSIDGDVLFKAAPVPCATVGCKNTTTRKDRTCDQCHELGNMLADEALKQAGAEPKRGGYHHREYYREKWMDDQHYRELDFNKD